MNAFNSDHCKLYSVSPLIPQRITGFRNDFVYPSLYSSLLTKVIVVLVGTSRSDLPSDDNFDNHKIVVLDGATNASAARNIGIRWLCANTPINQWCHSFIWFADDDCIHPVNSQIPHDIGITPNGHLFLFRLKDPNLDRVVGKYIEKSSFLFRYASLFYGAPSVICRLDICPMYNESLGPGTSRFAAEDTDFLIRVTYKSSLRAVISDLYLPHPYEPLDKAKIFRYGVGQGFVLRNLLLSGYKNIPLELPYIALFTFLLRPLVGSLISVVRLNRCRLSLYCCRLKGVLYGLFVA
jgi:hypothetical protein